MIKLNEMLKDFETIAKDIKQNTGAIKKTDFIARLVICYTEDEKSKKNNEYETLKEYTQALDNINFDYRTKDNKYFYLLKKQDFESIQDFETMQQMFCKKDKNGEYTPLTINLNNLFSYRQLLNKIIETLKTR